MANFFIHVLGLLNPFVDPTVKYLVLQEPSAGGIVLHRKAKGRSLKLTSNRSEASVEFHVFQAIEGFSKSEVADDTKGWKIVPCQYVESRAFRSTRHLFGVRRSIDQRTIGLMAPAPSMAFPRRSISVACEYENDRRHWR